jgi:hypothetical protein
MMHKIRPSRRDSELTIIKYLSAPISSLSIKLIPSFDTHTAFYTSFSDLLEMDYSDSRYFLSAIWHCGSGYQYQCRLMEDYPTSTENSVSICPNTFDPTCICGPGLNSAPACIPSFLVN